MRGRVQSRNTVGAGEAVTPPRPMAHPHGLELGTSRKQPFRAVGATKQYEVIQAIEGSSALQNLAVHGHWFVQDAERDGKGRG